MLEGNELPPLRGTARDLLERKGAAAHDVPPDATVYEAVAKLERLGVGALLVVEGGTLVGILSERDCTRRLILQSRVARETRVADVMSTGVITIRPDDGLTDCLKLVTNLRIRHLPVVDGGRVVGVLSIGDLVRAVLEQQNERIETLVSYIGSDYPK